MQWRKYRTGWKSRSYRTSGSAWNSRMTEIRRTLNLCCHLSKNSKELDALKLGIERTTFSVGSVRDACGPSAWAAAQMGSVLLEGLFHVRWWGSLSQASRSSRPISPETSCKVKRYWMSWAFQPRHPLRLSLLLMGIKLSSPSIINVCAMTSVDTIAKHQIFLSNERFLPKC